MQCSVQITWPCFNVCTAALVRVSLTCVRTSPPRVPEAACSRVLTSERSGNVHGCIYTKQYKLTRFTGCQGVSYWLCVSTLPPSTTDVLVRASRRVWDDTRRPAEVRAGRRRQQQRGGTGHSLGTGWRSAHPSIVSTRCEGAALRARLCQAPEAAAGRQLRFGGYMRVL